MTPVNPLASDGGPRVLMERLREGTRSLHARVETSVDLMGRCSTLDGYRGLLVRMLGLYIPLEAALGRLDWHGTAIDLEERSKLRLLRADLAALGGPDHVPSPTVVPHLPTLAAGFGCLYVLEGSTLGGQLILRHVSASLGVGAAGGASFFASYGPRLGAMWQSFGRAATAHCEDAPRIEEAVSAAIATFESFEGWLGSAASTSLPDHRDEAP